MRTHRPPPLRTPHTLHALSIGETRKVRQRGMLSKTLRKKKKKQGVTHNETK